jgi:PPOX class probable F420-dependent enzyme
MEQWNMPGNSIEISDNIYWRLQTERIIWLTTVSRKGIPYTRPVWFLWDGHDFVVYSKPNTYKLEHIMSNPKVCLHFDGDGMGGNIVVLNADAQIVLDYVPAHEVAAYVEKYSFGFNRINLSAEEFGRTYSIPILFHITRIEGH